MGLRAFEQTLIAMAAKPNSPTIPDSQFTTQLLPFDRARGHYYI